MNKTKNNNFPRKGEIWLLHNPDKIKEIGKDYRPVLIISDNFQNEYSESIVTLPLTTDDSDFKLFTEVLIKKDLQNGLEKDSKILCDSPFTWNKGIRFKEKIGLVSKKVMLEVKKAWWIAFFRD